MATLSDGLFQRIHAFLAQMAASCKNCFHAGDGRCETCAAQSARLILSLFGEESRSINAVSKRTKDERMRLILEQLKKANRPLRTAEIALPPDCSKENKAQALERLVFLKKIVRKRKNSFYVYTLSLQQQKETKDECNNKK